MLLKAVVTMVVVEKERLVISLNRRALQEAIWGPQDDSEIEPEVSDALALEVPARISRFGGEVRFRAPSGRSRC